MIPGGFKPTHHQDMAPTGGSGIDFEPFNLPHDDESLNAGTHPNTRLWVRMPENSPWLAPSDHPRAGSVADLQQLLPERGDGEMPAGAGLARSHAAVQSYLLGWNSQFLL